MYYAYNSITGRLIGAHRMAAYMPQGLQPIGPGEPFNPYPPNFVKPAPSAAQPAVRAASGSASASGQEYGKVPERVLRIRARLQANPHLPVHLKGGKLDYVMFYATVGLVVTGVCLALKTVYVMAFPKPVSDD